MRGGEKDERKTEFPFLIGTVRTYFRTDSSDCVKEFPFLIGTVRTKYTKKQTEKK